MKNSKKRLHYVELDILNRNLLFSKFIYESTSLEHSLSTQLPGNEAELPAPALQPSLCTSMQGA